MEIVIVLLICLIFIFILSPSKKSNEIKVVDKNYLTLDEFKKIEAEKRSNAEAQAQAVENTKKLADYRKKLDEKNADAVISFEFEVAGTYYRSRAAKEAMEILDFGDEVSLQFDPGNEYDPDAIKIIYDRKFIGFVPAQQNRKIGKYLRTYYYNAYVLESYTTYNEKYYDDDFHILICVYFNEERNKTVQNGVIVNESKDEKAVMNHPFYNKTFVITGTFLHYSREMVRELIEENGGIVRTALSKKTNYLVKGSYDCGPEKLSKAEILKETGLIVLTEEEFMNLLKNI